MASEPYTWSCHQAAVEVLLRMPARERRCCLDLFQGLAENPFTAGEHQFELPGHAPFFVVTTARWVCTYQVDHAIELVRLLARE